MRRSRILGSLALVGACTVGAVGATAVPAGARDGTLDASEAVVAPPLTSVTRTLAPVDGCRVLLDAGNGDCTVVRTAHGALVVTVEPGHRLQKVLASRPWTVRVYRPAPGVPDGWEVALETRPDGTEPGPIYAGVTAKAVDVTEDGRDELVLGYRAEGTGMILDVDVVGTDAQGVPSVLVHDQLYKGSVVFRHGRLVAWMPVYRRLDANCCPTWVERAVLRLRDGAFGYTTGPRLRSRRAHVPASELA